MEFDKQFNLRMRKAYTWDLFGAAYVMAGCNDDYGFSEFLCWLISRGEQVFLKALVTTRLNCRVYAGLSFKRTVSTRI